MTHEYGLLWIIQNFFKIKCTRCGGSGFEPGVRRGTKRCVACHGRGTREKQRQFAKEEKHVA
jgi:DnaJ-class molecular chaperone